MVFFFTQILDLMVIYHEWAFSVHMLLRLIGLAFHLINGPLVEATIAAVVVKAWRVANDRVMGILCMSIDVSIKMSFVDDLSAKKI